MRRSLLVIAAPLLAAPVFFLTRQGDSPQRLVFLQVGQGDCALIQDGGYTVMVDAAAASEYIDLGQRLAIPEMRKLGVNRIDMVLLTHPDSDHIGGLPSIARRWPIAVVAAPETFRDHDALRELQSKLPKGIEWRWMEPDSSLKFGNTQLSFDFMPAGEEDNVGSLAMLVEMGSSRAVLTGDGTVETEAWLAPRVDWSAEVLKAGHHGSRTSTSSEWLEEVRPRFAVISCGRGNRFGHPHSAVTSRIEGAGAKVLRTDWDGTLIFRPTRSGFQLE